VIFVKLVTHAPFLIKPTDYLVAFNRHIVTEADYLEIFRHLTQEVLGVRSNEIVLSLGLPFQRH
jgi:hypothetical protein